jgi:hypothetical protein
LALDRCEKTGAEVARAMDGNWDCLTILRQDVMTTVDRSAGGFELRDDFSAGHLG